MAKRISKIEAKSEIEFYYIKNNSYKTVHVDGAIGGISPKGKLINMAVYSERLPIPRQTTNQVLNGIVQANNETGRIQRDGIIREVETNLVFDIETAQALVDWLEDKISVVQKRSKMLTNSPTKKKKVKSKKTAAKKVPKKVKR